MAGIRARAAGFDGGNLAQFPGRWQLQSVRVINRRQKESASQNAAEALWSRVLLLQIGYRFSCACF